jgi:hypothetical protein
MPSIDHADGPGHTKSSGGRLQVLPDGAYLTDGKSLFRIERTVVDGPQGDLFVELEDCASLELIFCSARSIAELDLRTVKPRTARTANPRRRAAA